MKREGERQTERKRRERGGGCDEERGAWREGESQRDWETETEREREKQVEGETIHGRWKRVR